MSDYGTGSDLPLFDCEPYSPSPQATQDVELKRVTGKLAESILLFFDGLNIGETYHAEDLHQFVISRLGNAQSPESAGRVMRQLRAAGHIGYELVNRRQSLYRKV